LSLVVAQWGTHSGLQVQLAYYPADGLTSIVLANAFPSELEAVDVATYRARRGQ
jgi:hypothetical protein